MSNPTRHESPNETNAPRKNSKPKHEDGANNSTDLRIDQDLIQRRGEYMKVSLNGIQHKLDHPQQQPAERKQFNDPHQTFLTAADYDRVNPATRDHINSPTSNDNREDNYA